MAIEQNEFKFPDETPAVDTDVEANDIEIEIVDDIPEEDRKNATPLPKEIVEEIDNDDLEAYSQEAKTRLKQIKKALHDERRAKDQLGREQQEALNVAKQLLEENKRLKGKLNEGEKSLVDTHKQNVNLALDEARREYKEAYDSGDSDRLLQAQEKLTEVKMRAQQVEQYRPQYEQETLQQSENDVQIHQQAPKLDSKTQDWLDNNSWYGTDDDMSYLAMGIHRRLVRDGVQTGSDRYWKAIDKEMRQRFPEKFEDQTEETKSSPEPETKPSVKSSKPSNVVAPATRSTSPKRVTLTPTQVLLAKKFNLTPEQYARELTKLESQNG
jgi:hypothetical protein